MFIKTGFIIVRFAEVKKITVHTSAALSKSEDANTGKYIDTSTNRPYKMSNREKAAAYDRATTEGIGC